VKTASRGPRGQVATLLTSTAIALLGRRDPTPPGILPLSALRPFLKVRQAFLKLGALPKVQPWDEAAEMHRMLSAPRSGPPARGW